jgi:hypothetical protein
MANPTNTYNSNTNLSLGNVPNVSDPEMYEALLDIHNALEILLTASDADYAEFLAFLVKYRNNTPVSADYTVLVTDGTIEIDATAGDIIATLHPVAEGVGFRYNIKRIDTVTANTVTLLHDGVEYIDGHTAGINISTLSSYTVKTNYDKNGWNII